MPPYRSLTGLVSMRVSGFHAGGLFAVTRRLSFWARDLFLLVIVVVGSVVILRGGAAGTTGRTA